MHYEKKFTINLTLTIVGLEPLNITEDSVTHFVKETFQKADGQSHNLHIRSIEGDVKEENTIEEDVVYTLWCPDCLKAFTYDDILAATVFPLRPLCPSCGQALESSTSNLNQIPLGKVQDGKLVLTSEAERLLTAFKYNYHGKEERDG